MKIPLVHNSCQTPRGENQIFAQETGPLRCRGQQVLSYQTIPAVQTITVGAGE
jgi:hypothetical protein